MLSYGYVCLYAPTSVIASRIEASIAKTVSSHFPVAKDVTLKQSLIRAVELIGTTVHADHLKTSHVLTSTGEILMHLQVCWIFVCMLNQPSPFVCMGSVISFA